MSARSIGVGLAGYGYAGATFHAPLIAATAGLHLERVATSRPERVADALPGTRAVPGFDALIADPAVELVVITSPNTLHAEHAQAALEAGKHVVVEKPFTLTSAEADALDGLARRRGRVLSVFHNRRWDGDFLTVRGLVEGGRLGRVHTFESRMDRYRPEVRDRWREHDLPGSGLLYDLGPHLIDQALLLFGRPHRVFAELNRRRPGAQAVDDFLLLLHYPDLRVVLAASMLHAGPGPRFAVHGTLGSYLKDGTDPQEEDLKAGRSPNESGWGEDRDEWTGRLHEASAGGVRREAIATKPGAYPRYYQALAAAIRDGGEPPVSAQDAREGIRIVEFAMDSAARGRPVPWS